MIDDAPARASRKLTGTGLAPPGLAALVALAFAAHAPAAGPGGLSGGAFEIYTDASLTTPGLVGSYVDDNLAAYEPHDDWRATQPVAGSRVDATIAFTTGTWGERAAVGLTGGTDANWDWFSVQWDGAVRVVDSGVVLATRSNDSSRMWIDLDGDGSFDSSGPEFIDNHWGTGQLATLGDPSTPLSPGTYAIRIQYEERFGVNVMGLESVAQPSIRVAYVIPSNRAPQADAVETIRATVGLWQEWLCDRMDRNGFPPRTLRVETEPGGSTPMVHVVDVVPTDAELRVDVWNDVQNAAAAAGVSIWTPGEVWLLIPEIHVQHPDGSIDGGVALGGSFGSGSDPGLAMLGSAWLALAAGGEGLIDATPYDGLVVPAIGPHPLVQDVSFVWFEGTTISSVVSSYMGAGLHEVGHAIGLGHDPRNDQNFRGNVMGNGLRGFRGAVRPDLFPQDETRLAYAAAVALSTSRYLVECTPQSPLPGAPAAGGVAIPDVVAPPRTSRSGEPPIPGECAVRVVTPPAAGGALAGGENDRPVVNVLTTGAVLPVNGLLEIEVEASDETALAGVLLRRGDTWGEMVLAGPAQSFVLRTAWYEVDTANAFTVSVYDTAGNRRDASTTITPEGGANRAPRPSLRVDPPLSDVDATLTLIATGTADPDGASGLTYEWDVDDDGVFDAGPSSSAVHDLSYPSAGPRRVRVRVTDDEGAATTSTPVALRVGQAGGCAGDLDDDGEVGFADLLVILAQWGPCVDCSGDLDGDQEVGFADLLLVLAAWGVCSSP